MTIPDNLFLASDAAKKASAFYNSLPIEDRARLAPLLENYRQMGLAEAARHMRSGLTAVTKRVNQIQEASAGWPFEESER